MEEGTSFDWIPCPVASPIQNHVSPKPSQSDSKSRNEQSGSCLCSIRLSMSASSPYWRMRDWLLQGRCTASMQGRQAVDESPSNRFATVRSIRSFQSEWVLCEWIERHRNEEKKERKTMHQAQSELCVWSLSEARGRPNHHATRPIQAAHMSSGPSLAAHVAAKRYLRGRSSPPFNATWRMDVSFTMKRDASATKGAATASEERRNRLLNPPLRPHHHDDASKDGQNKRPSPHAVTKGASLLLLCVSPSPAEVFRTAVSKGEKNRNHTFEKKCWLSDHDLQSDSKFGQWTHVSKFFGKALRHRRHLFIGKVVQGIFAFQNLVIRRESRFPACS